MPTVTWPITAEQFTNEKLITDVLKIWVKVGSMHWMSPRTESWVSVGRDKVEAAVKRLMGNGEEAAEMRRRAEKHGVKAKIAVEEGGSSCKNADALIQELKSRRQS
jgi:abscisate beta-glucosyltransferase